ncbi:RNA polymerase sigma factor [Mangrovimonas aestuarii]|uniref:RNA polymerase sigma factor n=1 Tax=Mangrovimonas aestuarii TaxID=3018443 RepID=UPI002379CCF0|nr:sigma-70 family RNA polymerase sigma factor [Mangrovimonas aestuarii]
MTIKDDQHYINEVLAGNMQAFATIVNRYKDLVFTLALRMLKNREEAEEVAQDTFIKLYRSLGKFKGESKFSTFVYRVAYNSSLDRIKKLKKHYADVSIDANHYNTLKTTDNSLLETTERAEAVKSCINQLPGEDAVLITLFYYEEQSLKEISKITGMKENHVKVKLHRSRKKLAEIMKNNLEPIMIEGYEK